MKNICGFWYLKFSGAGWEEYDMDSFMNMHKSHDEYFFSVMFFRFMRVIEHDKEYYDSKYFGYKKKKWKDKSPFLPKDLFVHESFLEHIIEEFTKEQVCKLIPIIPVNSFNIHLKEDDIECELNETFEEVIRRLNLKFSLRITSSKCNICHNNFYKTVNGFLYCNCPTGLKWS